jgi:hypothetical protein
MPLNRDPHLRRCSQRWTVLQNARLFHQTFPRIGITVQTTLLATTPQHACVTSESCACPVSGCAHSHTNCTPSLTHCQIKTTDASCCQSHNCYLDAAAHFLGSSLEFCLQSPTAMLLTGCADGSGCSPKLSWAGFRCWLRCPTRKCLTGSARFVRCCCCF